MRHESGVLGTICTGSAAKKRNVLFGVALILVILIITFSYPNGSNSVGPQQLECEKQSENPPKFEIGTGPVIDEYVDDSNRCTPELQLAQASLSLKRNCLKDPLNFFLFWSTQREDFKLKHFRIIDSIFKHHPAARLHIFTKEMSIGDFSFYTAQSFDVVHHSLDPEKIFKNTPLDRWAQRISEWKQSPNYFSHVTDAMRLALLWKYGGVYLDTDAIVIRNLERVRNAVSVQHPTSVGLGEINGAVLIFDKMHPFLYYAMHLLTSIYDPNSWDIAGPQVVTKSVVGWNHLHPYMVRWVPEHVAGELELPNEPLGTPQITVFTDRFAFYGLAWWQIPRVDTTENHPDLAAFQKNITERAYAYHYVNQMVRKTGGKIAKGVYLFDLLQRSCLYECTREDLEISITELIDR